ncbi:hypothetical protein EDD15DRAFT_461141 [Pisolithus albus]|nr:hypothetical protein EDD15DRAFT_461141 [Pisolithus albus]
MTRVDGAASGCPNGAVHMEPRVGRVSEECVREQTWQFLTPKLSSSISGGQAAAFVWGPSHAHVGGGPRYDKQNFHSTLYTQAHVSACLYLNKFRERKREESFARHTTCAANMPIRFNSPQEFRATQQNMPSSSLPSSRSKDLRKYRIIFRDMALITDFSLCPRWSQLEFFRNRKSCLTNLLLPTTRHGDVASCFYWSTCPSPLSLGNLCVPDQCSGHRNRNDMWGCYRN